MFYVCSISVTCDQQNINCMNFRLIYKCLVLHNHVEKVVFQIHLHLRMSRTWKSNRESNIHPSTAFTFCPAPQDFEPFPRWSNNKIYQSERLKIKIARDTMGSEFAFLREASNKKLNKSLQIVFFSILEIRSQYDITY